MPCTLYIGGMKSGKSELAEKDALSLPAPRLYIATSVPIDEEMKRRVVLHQQRRIGLFETFEEPVNLDRVVLAETDKYNVTLIDCLTFWYNNLFYYFEDKKKRIEVLEEFVDALKHINKQIIIVTNEVGMGIIPDNKLAREFIDFSGWANQKICSVCNKAFFVVSGKKITLE